MVWNYGGMNRALDALSVPHGLTRYSTDGLLTIGSCDAKLRSRGSDGMSIRFAHRSASGGLFSLHLTGLTESFRQADGRSVERTVGWLLTAILLILWFALDWPSSVLLALMGLQLLVATSPRCG